MAVVYLKKQKFEEVLDYCEQALKVDHTHAKTLFLKARALTEKSNYALAIDTLQDLLLFDPENAEAKTELAKVQKIQASYENKSAKMAKAMFGN